MMKRIEATMGTFGRPNERVTPRFLFSRENVMSCSWNGSCAGASCDHNTMMMSAQLRWHIKDPRIVKKKNLTSNPVTISRRDRIANWRTDSEVDLRRQSFSQQRAVNSMRLWASFSIHAIPSGSSSSGRERGCQIRRLCGMGICIALCARYYTSQLQGTMPLFQPYERHADVSRYHCTIAE